MRPKRRDGKYWQGTQNFDHIQYESDLEDYIIDLENEIQQLRKHAVIGSFSMQDLMLYYRDADNFNFTSKVIDILNSMVNDR